MPHLLRRSTLALIVCGSAVLAGCGDSTDPVVIVKHLYFSQDGNANGLFEIDLATGAATLAGAGISGVTAGTVGLTETADTTLLIGSIWVDIVEIAADGSGANVIPNSEGVEALAMNTATGVLYAGINGLFFTVDPATGLRIAYLATPGTDVEGLAVDALNGVVYGLSGWDENLYAYDIAGDSWSVVGSTGMSWSDPGLAYDRFEGVLYGVEGVTNSLYRIDPVTAAVTPVGALGTDGGGGLAFVGYER